MDQRCGADDWIGLGSIGMDLDLDLLFCKVKKKKLRDSLFVMG